MTEDQALQGFEAMKSDKTAATKGYLWSMIGVMSSEMAAAATANLKKELELRDSRLRQQASRIAKLERALNVQEDGNHG